MMWTRRTFLEALSTGPLATSRVMPRRPPLLNAPDAAQPSQASARAEVMREGELVIERSLAGRPHVGKVLAAIQPHSDDLPLFAAGTVAKLVTEGYTGCLIRMFCLRICRLPEAIGRFQTTRPVSRSTHHSNT